MWYLYMVRCSDRSVYTGITTDVGRRLKEHNSKKGASYTRNKTPVTLIYQEAMPSRSAALKKEAQIKRLPQKKKLLYACGIYALPSAGRWGSSIRLSCFM